MTKIVPDLQLNTRGRVLVQYLSIRIVFIQVDITRRIHCGLCGLVSKIDLLITQHFTTAGDNQQWR